MKNFSLRWFLLSVLGSSLVLGSLSAEELVLGHFMGTNHPMHREVFLPLAETLNRSSQGRLTLRIVPDLSNPSAQYSRAVSGEMDVVFGLPGYTPDRFPRTQLIELPALADNPQQATRILGRNLDRALGVEFAETQVLSLWVNEAAVVLSREREIRVLEDFRGLRIRVADAQTARILSLMGSVPVQMSADRILPAFDANEIDAALIGASGVLPFRLHTKAKSCTVGFPQLLTSFYLVMNSKRWSGLDDAARGWLADATGPVLGSVATRAYEKSARQGIEALRSAGVPVIELSRAESARLAGLTGLVWGEVLTDLASRGVEGQGILDGFRPRLEVSGNLGGLEVRVFGARGGRYRLERSVDLIDWHPVAEFFGSPDGAPTWIQEDAEQPGRFFRAFELLQGSAEHLASLVAEQALIAAKDAKSTGVGGLIVENSTGRVIHAYGNRAIDLLASGEPFSTPDPTNHGETQLVGWYYANQEAIRKRLGYLPKPSELTVVTSLDPCAMCAGGLLTAGFNCGVLASDDSGGGVNWNSTSLFEHNLPPIQRLLRTKFGYYKVPGIETRSQYMGGSNVIFLSEVVSREILKENTDAFNESLDTVGKVRKNTRIFIEDVQDPSLLPADNPTRRALTRLYPEALSIRLTQRIDPKEFGILETRKRYYRVNDDLYQLLRRVNAAAPGSSNAIAMIDPHGNLLGIGVDRPETSPIATAMMNIVSDYSRLAFQLISEASLGAPVDGVPAFKRCDAFRYLSPVVHNTFIFLRAPAPGWTTTLKDLGIFGNASDEIFTYVEPPVQGTINGFENHVRSMPLYYQGEDLTPEQTVPPSADRVVSTLADSGPGSLRAHLEALNASGHYHRIRFSVAGSIRLLSELPVIRVPVTLDGASSPLPSNPSDPTVGIDFNGHRGLRFATAASGSQVLDLALYGARGAAIESETPDLELAFNRFGRSVEGGSSPNGGGSLDPGELAASEDVSAWQSPLVFLKRKYDYDQPLTFTAPLTLVSATRVDSLPEPLHVYYRKGSETGPLPPGLPSSGLLLKPAAAGALDASWIASALQDPQVLARLPQVLGKSQGGQGVVLLEPADWAVTAELDDGTPLVMSWMDHVGNTVSCEFIVHPRLATSDPRLERYLAKTYRVTLTLASPGANTRAQASEIVAEVIRPGNATVGVALYAVDNPITGAIGSLHPGDAGYNEAALEAARRDELVIDAQSLPAPGGYRRIALPKFNPGRSYGMVWIEEGGTLSSSYEFPSGRRLHPFLGFQIGAGRLAIGIEADRVSVSPDFADLILVLPDQEIRP